MSRIVKFEGRTQEFPDDASDTEIAAVLSSPPAAPAPAAPASGGGGWIGTLGTIAGNRINDITSAPQRVADALVPRDPSQPTVLDRGAQVISDVADPSKPLPMKPAPTTALGLSLPGGGSVTTRLGAYAAGKMMENPSANAATNLGNAVKGVIGDPQKPLTMLTAPAALEAVIPGFMRFGPGAKARIAAQDAANYGTQMEAQSPALAGARTAEDLRVMASGPGRKSLGDAKGDVVGAIEARVGDIRVPSLGGQPMSLTEANRQLTDIGLAGRWGASPVDRTAAGLPARQEYGQVAREIDAALRDADPAAADAFAAIQAEYRKGLALLKPLTRTDAFRKGGELQFNTPAIQRQLADPKVEAQLRARLGDEGFEALRSQMLRGGAPGEVDRLASGSGSFGDSLMSWLRGQNTGATQSVRVPITTALPNIGSQYAGKVRLPFPPALQAIIDAGSAALGDRK